MIIAEATGRPEAIACVAVPICILVFFVVGIIKTGKWPWED